MGDIRVEKMARILVDYSTAVKPGDRVMIEFICDLPYPPQSVAKLADLEPIEISPNVQQR